MLLYIGDDTPGLRELLSNVVDQYATWWRELGAKLGLKGYQIENITANNDVRQHRQIETCCRQMLEMWLQEISKPTWGKLEDAVNSLPAKVLSGPKGTGGYY